MYKNKDKWNINSVISKTNTPVGALRKTRTFMTSILEKKLKGVPCNYVDK